MKASLIKVIALLLAARQSGCMTIGVNMPDLQKPTTKIAYKKAAEKDKNTKAFTPLPSSSELFSTTVMLKNLDLEWDDDNVKLDFMTVQDLRDLLSQTGHLLDAPLYFKTATMVATLHKSSEDADSSKAISPHSTNAYPELSTSPPRPNIITEKLNVASDQFEAKSTTIFPTIGYSSATVSSQAASVRKFAESTVPRIKNLPSPMTPMSPPITLSLGSWSISKEELPVYLAAAGSFLILLFLSFAIIRHILISHSSQTPLERYNKRSADNNRCSKQPAACISTRDSIVCLSGERIESRIMTPSQPLLSSEVITTVNDAETYEVKVFPAATSLFTTAGKKEASKELFLTEEYEDTAHSNYTKTKIFEDTDCTYIRVDPVDLFLERQIFDCDDNFAQSRRTKTFTTKMETNFTSNTVSSNVEETSVKLILSDTISSTPSSEALDNLTELKGIRLRNLHSSIPTPFQLKDIFHGANGTFSEEYQKMATFTNQGLNTTDMELPVTSEYQTTETEQKTALRTPWLNLKADEDSGVDDLLHKVKTL